jgi:hypothetical protein
VNVLWNYLWPAFAAGLVVGVVAGLSGFRRRRGRNASLGLGLAAAIGAAALWHGPLGAADRLTNHIQRDIHDALVYYEMTQVTGHVQRGPLTRRIELSGPADDFQRSELARLMGQVPGASVATWSAARGMPLIAEGTGASLLGFIFGLLLAYLVELRRRHNAQWNW